MSFNHSSSFVNQGSPVSQPQFIPPPPPPPTATGGRDFRAMYYGQHPPPSFLTMFPAEIRPPLSTPTSTPATDFRAIPHDHIRPPLPPPRPSGGTELSPRPIRPLPPPPTTTQLQPHLPPPWAIYAGYNLAPPPHSSAVLPAFHPPLPPNLLPPPPPYSTAALGPDQSLPPPPPPWATILQRPPPLPRPPHSTAVLGPHPPLPSPPPPRMPLPPNSMAVLPGPHLPSPPLPLPPPRMGTGYYAYIYFLPTEFQGRLGPSQPPSGAGENGRPQVPLVPQENVLEYQNEENDDLGDNQEHFASDQEADAMDADDEEEENSDQDSDSDEDEDEDDNEGWFDAGEEDMDVQDVEEGQEQSYISVEDQPQVWLYLSTIESELATRIIYVCGRQHRLATRTIILHHEGVNAGTFTFEFADHEHGD